MLTVKMSARLKLKLAKLSAALVIGKEAEEIKFTNENYIYLPYSKVTKENVHEYLK